MHATQATGLSRFWGNEQEVPTICTQASASRRTITRGFDTPASHPHVGNSFAIETKNLFVVGDVPIACVHEDVDISSAPALRSLLRAASNGHERFVISFERCRYCDGSGITVLLEFQKQFSDRLALVIERGAHFRRILDVLGLLRTFNIFESVESAVAHLTFS
jgi:anti-anti-sigma factor